MYPSNDWPLSLSVLTFVADGSVCMVQPRAGGNLKGDLPVLQLSNELAPVPFLVIQRRFRLDLTCQLPQDQGPVIVNPFVRREVAAIPLDYYEGMYVIERCGVFGDELIVESSGKIEKAYLIRSIASAGKYDIADYDIRQPTNPSP